MHVHNINLDSLDTLCCVFQEAVTVQTFLAASCLSMSCELLQKLYCVVSLVENVAVHSWG